MDMSADFLTSWRRPKDPDDGHFGFLRIVLGADIVAQLRVVSCWRCLVEIDAVVSDFEVFHTK